jgi:hypothetical protein
MQPQGLGCALHQLDCDLCHRPIDSGRQHTDPRGILEHGRGHRHETVGVQTGTPQGFACGRHGLPSEQTGVCPGPIRPSDLV